MVIKKKTKMLSFILAVVSFCAVIFNLPELTTNTAAAATVTSIGLAEHGVGAYNDGWLYLYGGKGEKNSDGKRQSDCSGLVYAFFSDNGLSGPRTVTQQANASVQSGPVSSTPRIHGLLITIANYDHVGIYIGNNEVVDNSEPGVNMLRGALLNSDGSARRGWLKWHLLDNGMRYPVSGFYAFNGKMYHYTNHEYDVNTTVSYNGSTYTVGSDGVVCDSSGKAIPVDTKMSNSGYCSASAVKIFSVTVPDGTPHEVTGDGVRMRGQASTSGSIITTLNKGTTVYVTETVTGEKVTADGQASDQWMKCSTLYGHQGYMSAVFLKAKGVTNPGNGNVAQTPSPGVSAPVINYSNFYVSMDSSTENAAIYYTTDCSTPTEASGKIYNGQIRNSGSVTYKAIAAKGNSVSGVTTITALSNGMAFTDLQTNKWYFPVVEEALNLGIFNGKGNNLFAPETNITRAEFVSVLANIAGANLSIYENPSFADARDKWYSKAIAWAEDKGYIGGFHDGTFRPNANITREQMCVIVAHFAGLVRTNHASLFADDGGISSWAKDAVYACRDIGIITGIGDGKFAPQNSTTRAQAATVSMKYINMF